MSDIGKKNAWSIRGVLAGRYRGSDVSSRPLLNHAIWMDANGNDAPKTACGRISKDDIGDAGGTSRGDVITCAACAKKVGAPPPVKETKVTANEWRAWGKKYAVAGATVVLKDGKTGVVSDVERYGRGVFLEGLLVEYGTVPYTSIVSINSKKIVEEKAKGLGLWAKS